MNHHATGGQGWKRKLDAAREALDTERALTQTLRSYVEKRDETLRLYEDGNAVLKQIGAELAAEIAELRAHPVVTVQVPKRERLPDTRRSDTITLRIGDKDTGSSATLCLGWYDDNRLAEVFFRGDRTTRGASVGSFADAWATLFSYALQHGLSVEWMLAKARYLADGTGGVPFVWNQAAGRYEPHPMIHHVTSMLDYVAAVIERVLAGKPATRATDDERQATEGATP